MSLSETDGSVAAFMRAQKVIPGGVNSPVRAFRSVGAGPLFIRQAAGAYITDVDGNTFLDFVGSWGPMLLGHARREVIEAVRQTALQGTSFGAPTVAETEMAELITAMMPSVEKVRMVNSGTEATMSAVRLARGFTARDMIIKFDGCYHGHADSFLIKAGSGAATLGIPDSRGVTKATARDTLVARYNDRQSVEALFDSYPSQIAALIVEPVAGNMGVILPDEGFLDFLRRITRANNALLIFDEVITGFRVATGGAQQRYGVIPDLTTLGKIIGGGLPVGAYGGRADIMNMLAPDGPVYQAGTLSGNPLAMAAGCATLRLLKQHPQIYSELEKKSALLEAGLRDNLRRAGQSGVINRCGSMLTMFFTGRDSVCNHADAMSCDTAKYADYFRRLLATRIYQAPSQFECMFVSDAHTESDIEQMIEKSYKSMTSLK
ncbi:MAG: glutamate-1-semialdehyde 2,1-aminomutase [Bacteroidales bacterium]|jgi:glutamate-1-semialdehyde 2,1-aminomutase|nr:glutamate-1-semialdehyde 2,1-aminomutase [Bacteroidales bacterium]